MANKTREIDFSESKILPTELGKEMRTSFLEYSMSVIVARALPDVRDGLKPVHRRILYAMNESGLMPNRPHKKSAWTVGEVIGKYHPHGDTAVYDTMVRLAQPFSMRVPLVDGHGNFGSVDGDPPAAMRYTEARLQKAALQLLRDLDKDTVDFGPNYDESLQEPLVLPARFPNLLVNGSSGIAVGMATNIPPHNLGETIDAVDLLMENPEASVADIMKMLPGPDFPTGGIILDLDGIKEAYETGRGSITIRAKSHLEQTTTGKNRIIVTEIPYMVNKARLHEKIAELAREKKIPDISGIRDESDRKGMRLVIDIKKNADPNVVLSNLYKHTQMQISFGIIMIALVDGVPRTLSIKQMLEYYIKHQIEVIVRRTKYDLKKAEERAHILEGLLVAIDNIDEVIHIIRSSKDDNEASSRLIERFGLTKTQTDAILEMRLRRLTGLERQKIEEELVELREKIAYFKRVLGDENLVKRIIRDEMGEIKDKFGSKRLTQLSKEEKDIDPEDLIADENMVVTITRAGYVKRLPETTYKQQKRGGKGLQGVNLKEKDLVEEIIMASTLDYLLFFSTKGKVYKLKVYELPACSRHARGTAIVNLLPLEQGEKIAAVIKAKEFPDDEFLLFATRTGMVKKTAMSAYNRSHRDGIIAINLKNDDSLIAVRKVKPGEKVLMVSSAGKAIKWDEGEVRPMGRDTMGVKGMNVGADENVLGMEIATEGSDLFVVTENGYGKRTPVEEYPEHHRGGQGVFTIQMTAKKGRLACMKVVEETSELLLISEEGVVIRIKAADISRLGRSTQGVKVMNVSGTDKVSSLEKLKKTKKRAKHIEGQKTILADDNLFSNDEAPAVGKAEDEDEDEAGDLLSEEFDDYDEEGETSEDEDESEEDEEEEEPEDEDEDE